MSRPWHVWSVFLVSLLITMGALGWLSVQALELDQAEAEARQQAVVEDNARLALWRMESIAAPILARENARPYFAYSSFIPGTATLGKGKSSAATPSPLLLAPPPDVLLYFQYRDGNWTSPRVPTVALDRVQQLIDTRQVEIAQDLLTTIAASLQPEQLLAQLNVEEAAVAEAHAGVKREVEDQPQQMAQQANVPQQADEPQAQDYGQSTQRSRAVKEFQARSNYAAQNTTGYGGYNEQSILNNMVLPTAESQGGTMLPRWDGNRLLLLRKVVSRNSEILQGCLLNWPLLEEQMLAAVRELLPNARLEPVRTDQPAEQERMLAALPVRLEPGTVMMPAASELSPMQLALLIAWICLAVAAMAIAALLRGVVTLSERRAAFVSAVTHELRTPLTTFRMYSEMLAEGMVPGEANRHQYLQTLRLEADRLMHLVENVLIYARIERGGPAGRLRDIRVDTLLDHCWSRLEDRALQAGLRLTSHVPEEVAHSMVRADASAVEQVLFNLVDNACKYGASGNNHDLLISVGADDSRIRIRVRDHGQGLSEREVQRLFQPFRKSARDAANSAPGVGLGLALSRRLAREMGGDLAYDASVRDGACFVLTLRTASPPDAA